MAPKKAGSDHDGASPGKIFVGGLSKDTSLATFYEHFAHYGTITDHVIMKDRDTHRPRGFGFITYADPAVVDKVIEETHVINDKQVEIKRTIPKSSAPSRDIKTKKIFVGGIPASVNEDELKNFFTKYGKVVDQEILRDHTTKRSRGFGFVIFDSENVVDELLAKGNKIDFAGSQGVSVRVRRTTDYNPSLAAELGPTQPNSHLNLAVVGLISGATGGAEGPERIFVGGLPFYFSDAQIRELLESFG